MTDCIFCKIISREISADIVYEDENFLGFLDLHPLNPGHTLLIPKKHFHWVNDYEPLCEYWETARKLSGVIKKALNPTVVSYVVHGLGVPHAHIHLIPIFEGDKHPKGPNPEKTLEYKDGEKDETINKIKDELNNIN